MRVSKFTNRLIRKALANRDKVQIKSAGKVLVEVPAPVRTHDKPQQTVNQQFKSRVLQKSVSQPAVSKAKLAVLPHRTNQCPKLAIPLSHTIVSYAR